MTKTSRISGYFLDIFSASLKMSRNLDKSRNSGRTGHSAQLVHNHCGNNFTRKLFSEGIPTNLVQMAYINVFWKNCMIQGCFKTASGGIKGVFLKPDRGDETTAPEDNWS